MMKRVFYGWMILLGLPMHLGAQPRVDLAADSWTGLKDGSFESGGTVSFLYPKGPKGSYKHGYRFYNDDTRDLRAYHGL